MHQRKELSLWFLCSSPVWQHLLLYGCWLQRVLIGLSHISWGGEQTSWKMWCWMIYKISQPFFKICNDVTILYEKNKRKRLQENAIQRRNWILNLVVSLNLFRPLCWKSYNPPACIINTLPDVWLFTIYLIKSLKFMVSSLVSIWNYHFHKVNI